MSALPSSCTLPVGVQLELLVEEALKKWGFTFRSERELDVLYAVDFLITGWGKHSCVFSQPIALQVKSRMGSEDGLLRFLDKAREALPEARLLYAEWDPQSTRCLKPLLSSLIRLQTEASSARAFRLTVHDNAEPFGSSAFHTIQETTAASALLTGQLQAWKNVPDRRRCEMGFILDKDGEEFVARPKHFMDHQNLVMVRREAGKTLRRGPWVDLNIAVSFERGSSRVSGYRPDALHIRVIEDSIVSRPS